MARSLRFSLICLILAACTHSQPLPETLPENARTEVEQASDRFWASRQREDVAAHTAQFTETGILMVPGLPDAVGRAAIRELLEQRFEGGRTTDFKVHRREIQVVGDSAHELAWYSEVRHGQGESMLLEGRYLLVWNRGSDGRWLVHRNLFNFSAATPVDSPPAP